MSDHASLRIIDANVNRAREALRVMEDYARFAMDDAGLCGAIKELRHRLVREVRGIQEGVDRAPLAKPQPRGSAIVYRDTGGDVGTGIGTESEYRRADAAEVALAAGKRLSEALRAIEEYGKTLDPDAASGVEQIRYRGYEIERRMALTINARARFGHVRLYVLLSESLCAGGWFETAESALRGGADCLQLREKSLTDGELLVRARRLAALCRDWGRLFMVNDRPDVASISHAHGVHLGQDDLPVREARRVMPATCLLGVSTHTREQVERAAIEGPDYIAVGPMFDSPTKPQAVVAGSGLIREARALTSLPLAAIGGIDADNAGSVLAAGASCLCVCRAVISQPDVAGAVAGLRKLIEERQMSHGQ